MKTYNLEDLIKSKPEGTTHIFYNLFRYNYIKHDNNGYRVWIGIKNAGWSFKMPFPHQNYNELINLIK
jgi:hypothetical protein